MTGCLHPRYPAVPAMLIGRLAVHLAYRGRGPGARVAVFRIDDECERPNVKSIRTHGGLDNERLSGLSRIPRADNSYPASSFDELIESLDRIKE